MRKHLLWVVGITMCDLGAYFFNTEILGLEKKLAVFYGVVFPIIGMFITLGYIIVFHRKKEIFDETISYLVSASFVATGFLSSGFYIVDDSIELKDLMLPAFLFVLLSVTNALFLEVFFLLYRKQLVASLSNDSSTEGKQKSDHDYSGSSRLPVRYYIGLAVCLIAPILACVVVIFTLSLSLVISHSDAFKVYELQALRMMEHIITFVMFFLVLSRQNIYRSRKSSTNI